MDWQRRMLRLLVLLTLVPALIAILTEAVKTQLIWYFRVVDLVDLAVTAPLYLATLVLLDDLMLRNNVSRRLRLAFLLLAGVFIYGHAMHVTANAVNTFSTEIRDYRPVIPDDAYALLYFLDETLSHILIFTARYGLLASLLAFEHLDAPVAQTGRAGRFGWVIVLGVLFGMWEALVFTEGQKVALAPLLIAGLLLVWAGLWRRNRPRGARFLRSGPTTPFVAGLLPSLALALVLNRIFAFYPF